ncbi:hypothetical protein niasHS_016674 [Heterodera schachtii]|uniref:Uncharacterized protein n=1 Tax=Heterodera schachtii TaxID=97005 RepID=A0ABD2I3S1_HETSC
MHTLVARDRVPMVGHLTEPARVRARKAFQLRRSARLPAPDYRPLYRVKFHHSYDSRRPGCRTPAKQQRRSLATGVCERLQRRRLRTETPAIGVGRLAGGRSLPHNNNNNAG